MKAWNPASHRERGIGHDPEKPVLGLDPRVETGFPEQIMRNEKSKP